MGAIQSTIAETLVGQLADAAQQRIHKGKIIKEARLAELRRGYPAVQAAATQLFIFKERMEATTSSLTGRNAARGVVRPH